MKKKYLITGGLGFIGQAIAINLIEKNNLVTIIDNQFRHKNLKSFRNFKFQRLKSYIQWKSFRFQWKPLPIHDFPIKGNIVRFEHNS